VDSVDRGLVWCRLVGIAGRAGFRQGSPYRCKPAVIPGFKYFDFEFKKLKNETKIPKNTSRFIESNSVRRYTGVQIF
jgi:hypothetical protein